jgi:hypothetical protein
MHNVLQIAFSLLVNFRYFPMTVPQICLLIFSNASQPCPTLVAPATWESEAGESLEPEVQAVLVAWATLQNLVSKYIHIYIHN